MGPRRVPSKKNNSKKNVRTQSDKVRAPEEEGLFNFNADGTRVLASHSSFRSRDAYSGSVAVELSSQQGASGHGSPTKVKDNGEGIDRLTRAQAEAILARELLGRRSESGDLVSAVFDSVVTTTSAKDVLLEFLRAGFVGVKTSEGPVPPDLWSQACAEAAAHAQAMAATGRTPKDEYTWDWKITGRGGEGNGALFLNVLSIATHAVVACRDACHLDEDAPHLRYTTVYDKDHGLPLGNEDDNQDGRPDIAVIESSAFCNHASRDPARLNEFWEQEHNPFLYIVTHFPRLLSFCKAELAREGISDTNIPDSTETVGTAKFRGDFASWFARESKRVYLDLSRLCWPNVEACGEAKATSRADALTQIFGYLRQHRRSQYWMRFVLGLITTGNDFGLIRADPLGAEQTLFQTSSSRGAIDTIRVAFGLARSSREQRGYHPAFHLAETETAAIEDPHPAPSNDNPFDPTPPSKRQRTENSAAASSSKVTAGPSAPAVAPSPAPSAKSASQKSQSIVSRKRARATDKVNITKFRHRKAILIELDCNKRHPKVETGLTDQASVEERTVYYLLHVVQDNSSLVGRSSRAFAVARELTAVEKKASSFTPEQQKGRCFRGPYVLKWYYADHGSDCYRLDLTADAKRAGVQHVLYPNREWHCGDVLTDVRSFDPKVVEELEQKTRESIAEFMKTAETEIPEPTEDSDSPEDSDSSSDEDEMDTSGTTSQAPVISKESKKAARARAFDPPNIIPGVQGNRQDVWLESDLKRTLMQASSMEEFVAAFIDATEALRDLYKQRILHRDVSWGNILLRKETTCDDFFALLDDPEGGMFFESRVLDETEGGFIHDMDMAGRAYYPTEAVENNPKGYRTGTPPFMAIRLLKTGGPHALIHDLQSMYFTLFLYLITFPPPQQETSYPRRFNTTKKPWDMRVKQWAHIGTQARTLEALGGIKSAFFENPYKLNRFLQLAAPGFQTGRWMKLHKKVYKVFFKEIKDEREPGMPKVPRSDRLTNDRGYVDPDTLIAALRDFLSPS